MNKLLITTSIITLSFTIMAQESNAHTISTTARGSVQCLSPNGSVVSDSYCTAGNNAGRRPGIPSITCHTSHTHSPPPSPTDNDYGGIMSIDVDGDGIGDFSSSSAASRAGYSVSSQDEVENCGNCGDPPSSDTSTSSDISWESDTSEDTNTSFSADDW